MDIMGLPGKLRVFAIRTTVRILDHASVLPMNRQDQGGGSAPLRMLVNATKPWLVKPNCAPPLEYWNVPASFRSTEQPGIAQAGARVATRGISAGRNPSRSEIDEAAPRTLHSES
jgi:hypothetical protein